MPALEVKRLVKRLVKHVCPPVVWQAGRWCYRQVRPVPPRYPPAVRQVLSTRAEVEAMIARYCATEDGSHEYMTRYLGEYHFLIPTDLPADPSSPEYHAAQMGLYRLISGRDHYAPDTCEQTPIDLEQAVLCPFPYCVHSSAAVSEQLLGVARLIEALELSRPARVLELGSGYGKVTTELVQLGHDVTAVDVSADFLELGRRRCRMLGHDLTAVRAGMLDYRPEGRFDRVVFHKSFHHCADHEAMARRLDDLVAPGGAVVFASEPIYDSFYFPWGVRLDGQSIMAIGLHGWMELGFSTSYFEALLGRHGWGVINRPCRDFPDASVFVARRR